MTESLEREGANDSLGEVIALVSNRATIGLATFICGSAG
jgi:hypothetical protein